MLDSNASIADGSLAALFALIIYEYIITFGTEVEQIWGCRAVPALLFYLNRLALLGLGVSGLLLIVPLGHHRSV